MQQVDYRRIQVTESQETVSPEEFVILLRIRQLFSIGADIIIIEKRNGRPKVRPVGKPEG